MHAYCTGKNPRSAPPPTYAIRETRLVSPAFLWDFFALNSAQNQCRIASDCPSGGIGIHARLKIVCRKACGFNSHLGHITPDTAPLEGGVSGADRSKVGVEPPDGCDDSRSRPEAGSRMRSSPTGRVRHEGNSHLGHKWYVFEGVLLFIKFCGIVNYRASPRVHQSMVDSVRRHDGKSSDGSRRLHENHRRGGARSPLRSRDDTRVPTASESRQRDV